jgi:hypothetical protein
VKELIKALRLDRQVAERLNPYVSEKYLELWDSIRAVKRRYVLLWRNKFLTTDAKDISDMAAQLKRAADELARMQADGVTLNPDGGTSDDYALLITEDADVAAKYEMQDERDYWGEHDDDGTESETNKP